MFLWTTLNLCHSYEYLQQYRYDARGQIFIAINVSAECNLQLQHQNWMFPCLVKEANRSRRLSADVMVLCEKKTKEAEGLQDNI